LPARFQQLPAIAVKQFRDGRSQVVTGSVKMQLFSIIPRSCFSDSKKLAGNVLSKQFKICRVSFTAGTPCGVTFRCVMPSTSL
jgi:hypothetical protein